MDARISRGTAIMCTKALGMDTDPSPSTLNRKILGVPGTGGTRPPMLVLVLVPMPVPICMCRTGALILALILAAVVPPSAESAVTGDGVDAMIADALKT